MCAGAAHRDPVSGLQGELSWKLEGDGCTVSHLSPHLPVPQVLVLQEPTFMFGSENISVICSDSSLLMSHLICFVAESHIFPVQVHLVHGDPSAGRGLLGDAGASHSSAREAGGLAVRVVGAAPLGRRALAAAVHRSGVSC